MNKELFNELLDSVEEAGEIHRGERASSREFNFADPDVRAIRKQIGFSQSKFSALIGVSIRTLQNWEQGHRHPTGPAKVLLKLVQSNPESVFTELNENQL
ncbi:NadS family protein [methanotrophic endosymbiont of Bathymodiolus puteoserpentis (Logatchev)]|jgi:putative transcriptional regulator|uniref:NadS family protein n=1 Tax=methanotrophic endosymbiont of Bathymodiolus puteoserpentis (Logatchev) TaxID=343235 RepID=UPI0013CA5ECD|nr:NadS family protein [methanotrophic endosymbiont of Bathymodiolus puteoserpentis (Logatchev)]SHE22498.1 Transcriptional regulator, Cro/CI family [methanotrophic endosymbiont of Bathymodiolus puteoserpentis (Logatchev)]